MIRLLLNLFWSTLPGTSQTMANKTGLCPLPQEEPAYYTHILGIIVDWIIILIGLPGIITAIYALQRLVKVDHVAPVYVINLLVSDLFQIAISRVHPEPVL